MYVSKYTHMWIIRSNKSIFWSLLSTLCFIFYVQMEKIFSIFGNSSWYMWNCKSFIHLIIKWIKIGIHMPWTPEPRSPSENQPHYCMLYETSHDKSDGFISYNAINFLTEAEFFHFLDTTSDRYSKISGNIIQKSPEERYGKTTILFLWDYKIPVMFTE